MCHCHWDERVSGTISTDVDGSRIDEATGQTKGQARGCTEFEPNSSILLQQRREHTQSTSAHLHSLPEASFGQANRSQAIPANIPQLLQVTLVRNKEHLKGSSVTKVERCRSDKCQCKLWFVCRRSTTGKNQCSPASPCHSIACSNTRTFIHISCEPIGSHRTAQLTAVYASVSRITGTFPARLITGTMPRTHCSCERTHCGDGRVGDAGVKGCGGRGEIAAITARSLQWDKPRMHVREQMLTSSPYPLEAAHPAAQLQMPVL